MIIFDWGRTLYDNDNSGLFPGAVEILEYLSKKYILSIVSLVTRETPGERRKLIKDSGVGGYFASIGITAKDKNRMYRLCMNRHNMSPEDCLIVDDRVVRGISWGNRKGCATIWVCQGKFCQELPDKNSGFPTFTIRDIGELRGLL